MSEQMSIGDWFIAGMDENIPERRAEQDFFEFLKDYPVGIEGKADADFYVEHGYFACKSFRDLLERERELSPEPTSESSMAMFELWSRWLDYEGDEFGYVIK